MKKLLVVMFCMLFLAVSVSAAEEQTEDLGLFQVCYRIGTGMVGAKTFKVNLLVYTPGRTITGYGVITQPVNPPLRMETKLQGEFSYMTLMPRNVHILVTATGYADVQWPSQGDSTKLHLVNVQLRMVLTEDWKSGTASYKYLDGKGGYQDVNDVPVTIAECKNIIPAKKS